MRVVVIPAKEFTVAKQRLADALPAAARAALARAMLEDVLAALAGAPVDRVVSSRPTPRSSRSPSGGARTSSGRRKAVATRPRSRGASRSAGSGARRSCSRSPGISPASRPTRCV